MKSMGRGIVLIRMFFLIVINNEKINLTHHEFIDRISEQVVQIIKIADLSELTAAKSLIYLSI